MQDSLLCIFARRFVSAKVTLRLGLRKHRSSPFCDPQILYAFSFTAPEAPKQKRGCEITIISFSRSICRGGLAALIGVTGKPYPSCLSCHSHPIRPCGAPSPRGEGCDTRIPSSKKSGEAATSTLNPEPRSLKPSPLKALTILG